MHQDSDHIPRALVVENNTEVLSLVSAMVTSMGWTALSAASIKEAQAHLAGGGIDIMVTDLVLGDGDGIDLIHELRRSGDDLPAVVISSYASPELRAMAQEAGASDLLAKPFRMERLSKLLQQVLEERGKVAAPTP